MEDWCYSYKVNEVGGGVGGGGGGEAVVWWGGKGVDGRGWREGSIYIIK